jgi:hypothetical protein
MRISLKGTLRALTCIFAPLALPLQSLADDSNAAKVDAVTWGNMNQVMSGTSTSSPAGLNILTPQGLYVYIDARFLYGQAGGVIPGVPVPVIVSGVTAKVAFKNYLKFILSQPGVAGLLFAAPWSMLANPTGPGDPYQWDSLNDAFEVVSASGKTLQIAISPGANSPEWLFDPKYLSSCDFLFSSITEPKVPADCGYTKIFDDTEGTKPTPYTARLPMPWNRAYKKEWHNFLNALKSHVKVKGADSYVVSINVAGPAKVSGEMILPKALADPFPGGYYTPTSTPTPPGPLPSDWNANAAWNCLLANHYGVAPASSQAYYLNSDRAFIEEWAAAIDAYGEIFSGMTLTIATGNGLPDFSKEIAGTVTCNTGRTISVLAPAIIPPPPAFKADCDVLPPNKTPFPIDCAAEAAILAYFAEPSVGGPNAKATQENALSASDDVVPSLLTLSNASVKWLSQITAGGLATVAGPVTEPGAAPVMSRMLGGLQFTAFAFNSNDPITNATRIGCPYLACKKPPLPTGAYCAPPPGGTTCTLLSPANTRVEQALLNALSMYFAGTSGGALFAPPTGFPSTVPNNATPVSDAPLNYLQMWSEDFEYAAGFGNCPRSVIMENDPLKKNDWAKLCSAASTSTQTYSYTPPAKMPVVIVQNGTGPYPFLALNAQGLLKLAGANIPTTSPVPLPLFGYNDPRKNKVCKCSPSYFERGAFVGDDVCVSKKDKDDAEAENDNAKPNFAIPETRDNIPYGPCSLSAPGYQWRQAYMGDYVCVTAKQFKRIAAENIAGRSLSTCP